MQRKRPFSSSPSLKCALREIDCRINYEPENESISFWRSISRDTNVEVSALSQINLFHFFLR